MAHSYIDNLKLGTTQIALQVLIDPDSWFEQDFLTASAVELSEMVSSFGYKWWSKEPQDLDNVKVEVIDCLHFIISGMGAARAPNLTSKDLDELDEHVNMIFRTCEEIGSEIGIGTRKIELQELFSSLMTDATDFLCLLFIWSYQNLTPSEGYSTILEEIATKFTVKNNLNILRQHYGYKQGKYNKNWGGVEDNKYVFSNNLRTYEEIEQAYQQFKQ